MLLCRDVEARTGMDEEDGTADSVWMGRSQVFRYSAAVASQDRVNEYIHVSSNPCDCVVLVRV